MFRPWCFGGPPRRENRCYRTGRPKSASRWREWGLLRALREWPLVAPCRLPDARKGSEAREGLQTHCAAARPSGRWLGFMISTITARGQRRAEARRYRLAAHDGALKVPLQEAGRFSTGYNGAFGHHPDRCEARCGRCLRALSIALTGDRVLPHDEAARGSSPGGGATLTRWPSATPRSTRSWAQILPKQTAKKEKDMQPKEDAIVDISEDRLDFAAAPAKCCCRVQRPSQP